MRVSSPNALEGRADADGGKKVDRVCGSSDVESQPGDSANLQIELNCSRGLRLPFIGAAELA
jgi:hypothetical protein